MKQSGSKDTKGKREKSSGSSKKISVDSEDVKREQKLQAILLADSFERNFRPITLESPKVLLPLVNVPMLEYTIEFLAQNGVEELFIFCVWHAAILQDYISKAKWSSSISVRCITSTACSSAGDALRELDSMAVIRSDPFILISGDVISNMDLKKAIAFHKEKRKSDPNAIITVSLKPVQSKGAAGARPLFDDLVVALDKGTNQLLLFDDNYHKSDVKLPIQILKEHSGIVYRTDLLDCHVDICSPEFMLQFSDNFDYQDIRKDFIRNEVLNWELGMHVYGYMIQNEYAARVHDPRTYHYICRDIVTRWVYPIVPDSQIIPGSAYSHDKSYVYKESNTKISRSAIIGDSVVLGRGCEIQDGSVVNRTIIGAGCIVSKNCNIQNSHLWEGVIVESDVKISHSIICNGAVIKSGAVISRGCIISYGVIIGENVKLPEFTRVSIKADTEDSSSQIIKEYDYEIVGKDGSGFAWSNENFEDTNDDYDDDDDISVTEYPIKSKTEILQGHSLGSHELEKWKRNLWSVMPIPINEDIDSDIENDEDLPYESNDGIDFGISSKLSISPPQSTDKDLSDLITSGFADGHSPENLLLEIKGYKFAHNKTYADCLRGILGAMLKTCVTADNIKQTISKVSETFKNNGRGYIIVKCLIQDESDEFVVIESVEECILLPINISTLYPVFRYIIQVMYDSDLLSEASILKWINSRKNSNDIMKMRLFNEQAVQEFVDWIQNDEDDDEDGDEDED